MEKSEKFQNATHNVELEVVKNNINLLQQYAKATNDETRADIHKQMHPLTQGLLKRGYSPDDLVKRFNKAIKLNKYRPKNHSLFLLAKSPDLDYIAGEYDTFDKELRNLSKETDKNADAIRNKFNVLTVNRQFLSKQFALDWLSKIDKHKDLAKKVYEAPDNEQRGAYEELFKALVKDFCKQYDIPEKQIQVKVVESWEKSDILPDAPEKTPAFVKKSWSISLPDTMSKQEKDTIIKEFSKSPQNYPGSYEIEMVRVNLQKTKDMVQEFKTDLFGAMLASFVHEMNHVLDHFKPREGALGPQVQIIDKKTYVSNAKNEQKYRKSATELSAYNTEYEMQKLLKNYWRE